MFDRQVLSPAHWKPSGIIIGFISMLLFFTLTIVMPSEQDVATTFFKFQLVLVSAPILIPSLTLHFFCQCHTDYLEANVDSLLAGIASLIIVLIPLVLFHLPLNFSPFINSSSFLFILCSGMLFLAIIFDMTTYVNRRKKLARDRSPRSHKDTSHLDQIEKSGIYVGLLILYLFVVLKSLNYGWVSDYYINAYILVWLAVAGLHVYCHSMVNYMRKSTIRSLGLSSNLLIILFPLLLPDTGNMSYLAILSLPFITIETQSEIALGLLAIAIILDLVIYYVCHRKLIPRTRR